MREGEKREIIDGGRGKVGKESWRVIQRETERQRVEYSGRMKTPVAVKVQS